MPLEAAKIAGGCRTFRGRRIRSSAWRFAARSRQLRTAEKLSVGSFLTPANPRVPGGGVRRSLFRTGKRGSKKIEAAFGLFCPCRRSSRRGRRRREVDMRGSSVLPAGSPPVSAASVDVDGLERYFPARSPGIRRASCRHFRSCGESWVWVDRSRKAVFAPCIRGRCRLLHGSFVRAIRAMPHSGQSRSVYPQRYAARP